MSVTMITLARQNFQQFTNSTFNHLVFDEDFSDVTLACDDGQLVRAHKVILAAASPFFKTILRQAGHPNPLVHIQGIKVDHLKMMLEFIYLGRAGVECGDLEDFVEATQRLRIEGVDEALEEECRGENNLLGEEEEREEALEEVGGKDFLVEEKEEKVCEPMVGGTTGPRESVIVKRLFSQMTQVQSLEAGDDLEKDVEEDG